jgi:hypothetical protein
MGKADSSKASKPEVNQARADCVMAAIKLFARIEDAFGTQYAQQVFNTVSAPKFRRGARGLKLLAFVYGQLRAGRTKQDIVDHLTFRHAMSIPELDAETRRRLIVSRSRMLRQYGIAPATAERPLSVRAHIDKLLAEGLPPGFDFLRR